MIEVVPYKAEHLMMISLQEAQFHLGKYVDYAQAKSLESLQAFTGMADGCPVICAGLIEMHSERALAWAYVDAAAGKHFIAITKAIKRFLDICPYRRIEAEVAAGFANGHQWARMLGFTMENPCAKAYFPDGQDAVIYARIR